MSAAAAPAPPPPAQATEEAIAEALLDVSDEELAGLIDPSEYALDLDEWGKRQGRDVLKQSERLQKMGIKETDLADCFGAAFEPFPVVNENCGSDIKKEFFRQLIESPDFQQMHDTTVLNNAASEIAACAVGEKLIALIQVQPQPQSTGQNPNGAESPKTKNKPSLDPSMQAAIAAASAAANAAQQVNDAVEACQSFGIGGSADGKMNTKAITDLFKAIKGDQALMEISKLAGRYRRLAASKQRQKSVHGIDEVVGIERGNDASKMLPHELAFLCVEELELETLRRYTERQMMQRENKATETVGKGPIMIAVDESGSMSGANIHHAKAFALALGWIARKQNRWCCLISWANHSSVKWTVMEPRKWDQKKLTGWLSHFFNGGTHPPLERLPKIFEESKAPKGKTDIIMLTDACCGVDSKTAAKFNEWKQQEQVKMLTIVLNAQAGDMEHVSDEVHLINKIDTESEAISRALSI